MERATLSPRRQRGPSHVRIVEKLEVLVGMFLAIPNNMHPPMPRNIIPGTMRSDGVFLLADCEVLSLADMVYLLSASITIIIKQKRMSIHFFPSILYILISLESRDAIFDTRMCREKIFEPVSDSTRSRERRGDTHSGHSSFVYTFDDTVGTNLLESGHHRISIVGELD